MSISDELSISQAELDTSVDEVLLAAAHHDITSLRILLRNVSPDAADPDSGYTPLHAAIAACAPDEDEQSPLQTNGRGNNGDGATQETIEQAEKTIKFLFQQGASWNQLDRNSESPGCLASRLGLGSLYELIVDAGVRAELLLNRMDEYEPLPDEPLEEEQNGSANALERARSSAVQPDGRPDPPAQVSLDTQDERQVDSNDTTINPFVALTSHIEDSDGDASRHAWMTFVLSLTARKLLPTAGLRILNIGHSQGLFDQIVQEQHNPAAHHIIEADKDTIATMQLHGWITAPASGSTLTSQPHGQSQYQYQNVTVHQGHWQDIFESLVEAHETFDAIFFEAPTASYFEFRDFISNEHLADLLSDGGVWSFSNWFRAQTRVTYDVQMKVMEMDLFEAGFDVEWEEVDASAVTALNRGTEATHRGCCVVEKYRLPLCRAME